MAGMRDRLVHDYMGVNYYIVWDVAKNIIPELTNQIQEVIDASQEQVSSPDTDPQTLQSDEEPLWWELMSNLKNNRIEII